MTIHLAGEREEIVRSFIGKKKVSGTNGTRKSLKPLVASVCAPACAVP